MRPIIVWFQHDLRTEDHSALAAAIEKGRPIIPLYIWSPHEEGKWSLGSASQWWLHHSLKDLQHTLRQKGLNLIIRAEHSIEALLDIIETTGAEEVFWHRRYEPAIRLRDSNIEKKLTERGIKSSILNDALLFEPAEILNKQKKPYQVFTMFWNYCLRYVTPQNLRIIPSKFAGYRMKLETLKVEDLDLLSYVPRESHLEKNWKPGCSQAMIMLDHAVKNVVGYYPTTRDRPDMDGVSKLSPYLHFGEISPRQVWHAVKIHFGNDHPPANEFLRQLGWREFANYLLYHFPSTITSPLKTKFAGFPWTMNDEWMEKWQEGQTGFPLVDAGMRQLKETGWMHNRVRMVVASFLVKDLMIPWQIGARWFWERLVDADLANNTLGWQWVAGCGADASPWFRVFNPTTQGEKFDITRDYVRQWVPELKSLPDKWIYQPSNTPSDILKQARVKLGIDYPYPIVDHTKARLNALEAYAGI